MNIEKMNKKILVVDDDETTLYILSKLLKRSFKTVTSAINGKDGLDKFKKDEFDIVLSDINMPELNGIDLCIELKKINKNIFVVAATAHHEEQMKITMEKAGFNKILYKPLHRDDIASLLDFFC